MTSETTEGRLSDEDIAWLMEYAHEVRATFSSEFDASGGRFTGSTRLLERFDIAVNNVLEHGRSRFRAVDEAHNELCVAAEILDDPEVTLLAYEPVLTDCPKSIDFRADMKDGRVIFVDVKTIKPVPTDRWDQFERAQREGWFPPNVKFILSKEWLGGELWHSAFVARSRMLEYAMELENKISECKLSTEKTSFVMMYCGEGFYWHRDELEDFAAFYFAGTHRPDDPFALAEDKYMREEGLKTSKAISRFACMSRPQGDIRRKRIDWNVQAPPGPGTFMTS